MKKRIVALLLTLVMVLSLIPTTVWADDTENNDEFRVVISLEGLTLGQGLYVKPKAYTLQEINDLLATKKYDPYTEDTLTAGMATLAMLIDNNLEYTMTGDWDNNAYLSGIKGIDTGEVNIPSIITDNGGPSNEENDGNNDEYLGEFDYSSMSGWMITVNNAFTPEGCGQYVLESGTDFYNGTYVIRWHFTVYGYGLDLGLDTGWGSGAPYFTAANKDLLYVQYALSTDDEAKAAALPVMKKLTATQNEVDEARAALKSSTPTDPTDPIDPIDPKDPTDPGTTDTPQAVSAVLNATMAQLAETVTAPAFNKEWTVLSLARGGYYAPDDQYFTDYYKRIVDYVNEKAASVNRNGALDKNKSTENSRLILALSAIGKNATSVGDWNLVEAYSKNGFDWITKQGINGPIFALLALDSHNYTTTDATIRQQCVDYILREELPGGGWALRGTTADPDITAMALQALAKYEDQPDVKAAAERAFNVLSKIQKDNGGYASWGSVNSESIAQVIVAATAWGIDPDTDSRFVKNGKSAVDALLTFYVEDGHGFAHVLTSGGGYTGGKVDSMATDQACYALVAYDRFQKGKTALYDMRDAFKCAVHAFGDWTVTTSPTCTESGIEKRTCTACGAEETRTVEAKGHTFGEWVITKKATRTEQGLKTRTCSVCDAIETQVIPALGNRPSKPSTDRPSTGKPAETVKSSQTGDNSQMTLWLGGVLLSAAALTVLTRKRKRSAE